MAEEPSRFSLDPISLAVGRADWEPPMPGLPGGRDMRRYLVCALVAAVPCVVLAAWYFGARIFAVLAVAAAAAIAVEIVFALVRKRPVSGGALTYAVLFALVMPFPASPQGAGAASQPAASQAAATEPAATAPASQPGAGEAAGDVIPLWMIAIGSAVGIFFGKEVFGGTGHHVFSPVLIGKGFLMFSYPVYPAMVGGTYLGNMVNLHAGNAWMIAGGAILLGAVAMVVARPGNWQSLVAIVGTGLGLAYAMQASDKLPPELGSPLHLVAANGFLFGACFLACDPAISPHTWLGKWIYGVLIGGIAVLMRCFSNYSEAMLSAILVGNLFAPMLDVVLRRTPTETAT